MRRPATAALLIIAVLILGWLALGFVVENSYYRLLLTLVPIWAAFGLAWNIFSGYSGLVSFRHAAFFRIGAHTVALLCVLYALTPWIGLPIAVVIGAVAGVAIGYPTFRL